MKRHQLSSKTCMLCGTDFEDTSEMVVLHKTRRYTHILCDICTEEWIENFFQTVFLKCIKRYSNPYLMIPCPGSIFCKRKQNICKHSVSLRTLSSNRNLSEHSQNRIEQMKTITSHFEDIYFCEHCSKVIFTIDDDISSCPECKYTFCSRCKCSPYHHEKTCIEYKVQNITDSYLIESLSNNRIKTCPECFQLIEKTSGCNKMVCDTCHSKWCWLCKKQNIDYSHFSSVDTNTSKCKNKLWE